MTDSYPVPANPDKPALVSYTGPPLSDEEVAAFRRELRRTVSALFGPGPERVEITATFVCVCDGTCPQGCIHCIACSGRPAEVTEGSEGEHP